MGRRRGETETKPRRSPRQPRARVTRDAMIVAAERVLATRGPEGLTTNHVAEVAGVSIGSVYQYFPNKHALVAALVLRNAEQLVDVLERTLIDHRDAPPERVLLTLGEAYRTTFHGQGKVHLVLYEQLAALGMTRQLDGVLDRMSDRLARYLTHSRWVSVADPRTTAWVLVRAVEGVLRAFAINPAAVGELAVIHEIIQIVMGRLPRAARAPAAQ